MWTNQMPSSTLSGGLGETGYVPFLSRRYPAALHRGIIMLFHSPGMAECLENAVFECCDLQQRQRSHPLATQDPLAMSLKARRC
jgi:hypothetical protein